MNGIETLAKDFFENMNVCTEPKNLNIGDEVYIIDPELIDPETEFYAMIPAVVMMIDESEKIPGRKYYYFKASGSKIDIMLNNKHKKIVGGMFSYYKYLENTSPYIFTISETIDLTGKKNEP